MKRNSIEKAIRTANWKAINRPDIWYTVEVITDSEGNEEILFGESTDCYGYNPHTVTVFTAHYAERPSNPSMEQHAFIEESLDSCVDEAMKTLEGARK